MAHEAPPVGPPPHTPAEWRRPGLYPSLWPADHGDVERSQCAIHGGLPTGVKEGDLKLTTNPELYHPLFLYTRNPDELFVYGRGEMMGKGNYVARVDARTLEIRERLALPFTPYVGGGLVHESGDVYLVHGTRLYRFPQGRLDPPQVRQLPLINGVMTVYNGLTVASDGVLILKGWAVTREDVPVLPKRQVRLMGLGVLLALGGAVLAALRPDLWGLALGMGLAIPLLMVGVLRRTKTSLRRFLGPIQPGVMMTLDPVSLASRQEFVPPERLAFGRVTVMRTVGEGPDQVMVPPHTPRARPGEPAQAEWVLAAGDTRLHRLRYADGRLSPDETWSERYRTEGDGSTMASAPTPFGTGVFVMDNVSPGRLTAPRFRLFRKDLDPQVPTRVVDTAHGAPGFNYWTVALDTVRRRVLTWDSLTGWVSAHAMDTLEKVWEAQARSTDCLTLGGEQGHVYTVDYDGQLSLPDFRRLFDVSPPGQGLTKSFVVLDAETGRELLRKRLGQTAPTMSMIMPGIHADVFIGTRPGLVRLSVG